MKTILLIHGPNLNALGKRDKKFYGSLTLTQLVSRVKSYAKSFGLKILPFQSNFEGALINFLQNPKHAATGIIINPGALAHYSYALYDAIVDTGVPAVEVHLSNIKTREAWRRRSVTAAACKKMISGKKEEGYFEALRYVKKLIK